MWLTVSFSLKRRHDMRAAAAALAAPSRSARTCPRGGDTVDNLHEDGAKPIRISGGIRGRSRVSGRPRGCGLCMVSTACLCMDGVDGSVNKVVLVAGFYFSGVWGGGFTDENWSEKY